MKPWYKDKNAMIAAAVFSIIAYFLGEGVGHFLIKIGPFLDEHPNFKDGLTWLLLLFPWLTVFMTFFLYRRAAKASKSNLESLQLMAQERDSLARQCHDSIAGLAKLEKWLGIEEVTGLQTYIRRLIDSDHHPTKLLDRIDVRLDFMGHGASKWTSNREKLEAMLLRIAHSKGRARFLVINPTLPGLETHRASKIALSLRTLLELKAHHTNMDVRVYNHIPQLRLTFYDDSLVVVGHYQGLERKDSSDTPLLVFSRKCDWSFYKAFHSHFDEEWDRARTLNDREVKIVNQLANAPH